MINEKLGIATDLFDLIKTIKDFILNVDVDYFKLSNKSLKTEFPINSITIEKIDYNGIKGYINIKETNDEYGNIVFNIILTIYYDFSNPDLNKIDSFLNHEFHHFYDRLKKVGKETKTKKFNELRNELRLNTNNPILLKFINCFYLSLDEEINARVQQSLVDIRTKNIKETQPYDDAMTLLEYNINEIDNLSEKEKNDLINSFNKRTKYEFKDLHQFKKYFANRFKIKGKKLLRKMFKVTSLNENEITLFYDLFNERMFEIFKPTY